MMLRFLFILILGLSLFQQTKAQDTLQGAIHYKVSIDEKGAPIMQGSLADTIHIFFKGNAFRTELRGGLTADIFSIILSLNGGLTLYSLDTLNRIAYIMGTSGKQNKQMSYYFDPTGKKKKINNIACSEYKIIRETKNGNEETTAWFSEENDITIPFNAATRFISFPGIEGFPVRIETTVSYQSVIFKLTIEAYKIDLQSIQHGPFKIPEGYLQKPYPNSEQKDE